MYVDTTLPPLPPDLETPPTPSPTASSRTGGHARSLQAQDRGGHLSRHDQSTSSVSFWTHLTSRGHEGVVNCVAAGVDVDYIVSGGQDYTTRVWKQSKIYKAFDLHAKLTHSDPPRSCELGAEAERNWRKRTISRMLRRSPNTGEDFTLGVTSVGFAGRQGPVVSGTCDGQVGLLCLASEKIWVENLHKGSVDDMFVEIEAEKIEAEPPTPAASDSLGGREGDQRPPDPFPCGPWLLATASADQTVKVMRIQAELVETPTLQARTPVGSGRRSSTNIILEVPEEEEGGEDKDKVKATVTAIDEVCVCHHDGPVQKVRYISSLSGTKGGKKASIASCTLTQVHLWSLHGEQIASFAADQVATGPPAPTITTSRGLSPRPTRSPSTSSPPLDGKICSLTVANKTTKGSLLFAGGKDYVSVWGLVDGELCDSAGVVLKRDGGKELEADDLRPLATYRGIGTMLDIDQAGVSTDFAVDLRNGTQCYMWKLAGAQPGTLLVDPPGPVNLLINPTNNKGCLQIMHILAHESEVTDMQIVEDTLEANGAALLVSCKNGKIFQWDLEGHDAGEICAELRSLRPSEIISPLLVMVLTFLQVLSFAFGPSIPWRREVRTTADFTTNIAFANISFAINIRKELIFIPEVILFIAMMLCFILFAALGVPEKVDQVKRTLHGSQEFVAEVRAGDETRFKKRHLLATILSGIQTLISLFMWTCSTILVAPMFKTCVETFECVPPDPGTLVDAALVIQSAPRIPCGEGIQRHLSFVLPVLLPVYFVSILPFAVVAGDPSYISYEDFWNPRPFWGESSKRKATVLHIGPLHANPDTAFKSLLIECAAKALLPCLQTIDDQWIQMGSVTLVGIAMLVGNWVYPNRVNYHMKCVVRGLRATTVWAMLCGCLTVALGSDSWVPIYALVLGIIVVIGFVVWSMWYKEFNMRDVMRFETGESERRRLDGISPLSKSFLRGLPRVAEGEEEAASEGNNSSNYNNNLRPGGTNGSLPSVREDGSDDESAKPLLQNDKGLKGVHVENPAEDQERHAKSPFRQRLESSPLVQRFGFLRS